jgi:hypothetical protein
MTEDGPNLSLAEYGLVELSIRDYPTRTKACVLDADAVLWFGNKESPGGKLSLRLAREASIDSYVVIPENTPREVAGWLAGLVPANESVTLMVAGSRESRAPGIGAKVEGFMAEVFRLLAEEEA